jgi:uncharacterized protein
VSDAAGARIVTLDLIRGVAVMGIVSVNIIGFAMIEAAYLNPAAFGGHTGIDLFVWAANMLLIDGKMRALFSMLFGASMLLVLDRAEAKGEDEWRVHARRMLVLLGFGLAHYVLLWTGDILHLYAVAGLILYGFRHSATKQLLLWACVLMGISMASFAVFSLNLFQAKMVAEAPGASAAAVAHWHQLRSTLDPDAAMRAREVALRLGPWSANVLHHLARPGQLLVNTLAFLPETLGLMMIGMAAFRSGLFTGAWSPARYRKVAIWGLGLGLAGHAVTVWLDWQSGFAVPMLSATFLTAMTPFRVIQALGSAALIILLGASGGWLARRIAAVGRTAFTNYVATSLLLVPLFAGWGLGLFNQLSRAEAWLLVPAVWAIMLGWSGPWLQRYRYGPFEWLWRSMACGERQPMRRLAAT